MKKSLLLAVLGMGASVASSSADGFIVFSSYNAIIYNPTTYYSTDSLIGSPYVAELYYAIGLTSDPVDENSVASIISAPSPAFTLYTGVNGVAAYDNSGDAVGEYGLGYFDNGVVDIPGYPSSYLNPYITFEVVAFDGSSYSSSADRGRSGSFIMDGLSPGVPSPITFFGGNGETMPAFVVASAPEPSTLVLTGVGGLAFLLTFRRRLPRFLSGR
jgi:hypothetical protein